ncbi:MAG: phosphoribosylglycinamide formyltransferase [Thermoleophilaceae bacterium]
MARSADGFDSGGPGRMPADGRRIAVLASGNGSNLQAVIDACAGGRLPARVVAVMSDRPDAYALERAWNVDIPAIHVGLHPGESRADYDARLADVVAAHRPDVILLAGWMRILTMAFLGRFPDRVVNLHPALPGELPGARALERAWHEALAGERTRTGVMVHLVPDEGIDDGPVLASREVAIRPDDTLETLAARVHEVEHTLLVDALRNMCTGLLGTRSAPTPATPTSAAIPTSEGTTR